MSTHHTILGQMLQLFPRYEFEKAVSETKTEYHARGFKSWNHFVAMLFGQLSGQDSLRGIEAGLASQSKGLYHLGIAPVNRPTLSYANKHRSHKLFEKVFFFMLSKCQSVAPQHKFKFKNPLYSLDITVIDLCLSLFDWAKFHSQKGAVKLHVKLNHAGYLPSFMAVTEGRLNEHTSVPLIPLEKGDVVVFDRGYTSFGWYASLCSRGTYFVTRLKKNAKYRVVKNLIIPFGSMILEDQIIYLEGNAALKKLPFKLRRVVSQDPQTKQTIVILTNQMTWSSKTISLIYKDRWQIEIFFKALKQQLKVKSFVGNSKNALLSQLWAAMTAYLLLSYLKFKSKFGWSLYTLSSILPTNLFTRRDLWGWLNAPFKPPGLFSPISMQYELALG